jgi:hypothetical protein
VPAGDWSKLQGLGRSWCSGRSPDSPSSRSAERVGRSWWFGEAAAPAVDLVGWRVTNSSRSPKRISDIPWLVWVVPSSLSYLVRVLRQVRFSPRSVFRSTRSRALRMPRAFASPLDDWVPPPPCSFAARTSTHHPFREVWVPPGGWHRVYAHEAPAFCKPLFCSRARVRFVKSPRGRFAVDSNR